MAHSTQSCTSTRLSTVQVYNSRNWDHSSFVKYWSIIILCSTNFSIVSLSLLVTSGVCTHDQEYTLGVITVTTLWHCSVHGYDYWFVEYSFPLESAGSLKCAPSLTSSQSITFANVSHCSCPVISPSHFSVHSPSPSPVPCSSPSDVCTAEEKVGWSSQEKARAAKEDFWIVTKADPTTEGQYRVLWLMYMLWWITLWLHV